jgi:hypothetical protein
VSDWSFRPPLTTQDVLAALFPRRDPSRARDERLCREIVARGICAPTEDLGIAVRACLAHIDSVRAQRDDMSKRWARADEATWRLIREQDAARAIIGGGHTGEGIVGAALRAEKTAAELRWLRFGIAALVERMGGSNG